MDKLKSTLMGQSPGRAVVHGGPGVGKTELCIQLLYDQDIRATFGGNRYFVDLQASHVNDIIFKIAHAIDLSIFSTDPLQHVKSELARSRSLLVLDNFQDALSDDRHACEEFLRKLEFDGNFQLIVSLRGNEGLRYAAVIALKPLDMKGSIALFNDILNDTFADDPDLRSIVGLTGGLPLVIYLMARHAETVPNLAEMKRRYCTALMDRYTPELIAPPDDNDEFWESLGKSLALAISDPRLQKEGKQLLSMLSCLPHGLAYEDLYKIYPEDAAWHGARQLEKTGLASQSQERDRLYLLEPIRAYVQCRAPPKWKDLRSLNNYFLELADHGNDVHKENGSIWRRKLESEFANIQIIIAKGLESHDRNLAIRAMQAAAALGRYQRFAGRGSMGLLEKAITLPASTNSVERSIALAECLRQRGSIMQTRCEPRRALSNFERAKEIYEGLPRAVETALGIAHCVSNVAESKRLLSDDHAAIVLFQKALDGYAQAETLAPNGHNDKITRGKAFCHQRLGALAQGNMEYDEARARFDKALTFFTEIGDLIGQASCRKGIGDL